MQYHYENISEKIKTVINELKELPTLPLIAHKVIAYLNSPYSGAKEIAELIKNDQSLASKVLKLINSAYFGIPRKVDDIKRAIVLLGFNNILQIVVNLSIMKTFGKGNSEFNRKEFWKHSIAVGICAQHIARKFKLWDEGSAYTAGLLHDIGKIILDNYFHDEYIGVITYAEVNQKPVYEVEQDILGITHSQIGNILLMKWNLPKTLKEAVKYHHYDLNLLEKISIKNKTLVHIIKVSDLIVSHFDIGHHSYPYPPDIKEDDLKPLNIPMSFLKEEKYDLQIEVENSTVFLEIWE